MKKLLGVLRQAREYHRTRFGIGTRRIQAQQPPDAVVKGIDWKSLAPSSLIVDLGGGVGVVMVEVPKAFPELNVTNRNLTLSPRYGGNHYPKHTIVSNHTPEGTL
ncbi:hypothetical protein AX16_003090 [Volvariella volvacea WC 439]|nr:hypothetical protein AX16_003090 [Volvariella volvacea WC 439]